MLRAIFVDPRAEPIPEAWSDFVRSEALPGVWDAPGLAALAWCAQAPTYLAVILDGADTPAAVFHARYLGLPADPRCFAGRKRIVAGIIECRLPPTFGLGGYSFAASADRRDRAAALVAYELGMRAILGRGLAGIFYRNVPPADRDLFAPGRLARRARSEPVIVNRWTSIDEYLSALKATRRSHLTRVDAALARDGIKVDEQLEVDPHEASRLARSVALAHRHWRQLQTPIQPPIPTAYFDALAHTPGVRFLTYRAGSGRLLAFATFLDAGGVLVDSVWGSLGPRDGGRRDLYQHHYLRAVGRLIDRGLTQMALGKGLTDMKLGFGARLDPRYLVAAR